MKCDVCGSENLEGAAYCEDCGGKLVIVAAPQAVAPSVSSAPPPPAAQAPQVAAPAPQVAAASATQQCASCGAMNLESEAYCVDCGANLRPAAAPPAPTPVVAPVVAAAVNLPPPAPASVGPCLVLRSTGQQFPLTQDITTMGRRSLADQIEPDIDLTDHDPDAYVSRRHAKVTRCDGGFVFEDVGSSNGSTINGGARIAANVQHQLKGGDRVTLGRTEFEFRA